MNLGLTSGLLATLLLCATLALPLATVLTGRRRAARSSVGRDVAQWVLIVASQVAGILAVLAVINNQFGLYASWEDLLGRASGDGSNVIQSPTAPAGPKASSHRSRATGLSSLVAPARPVPELSPIPWSAGLPAGFTSYDSDTTYLAMVAVPGSSVPLRLYVALPPEYFQPAYARARFPVVELFHGYPGTPTTWFHAMDVRARLRDAVGGGGTPFVLVVPQISVPGSPDLECTDLPGQPQVATFLTAEVHSIVASRFRVRQDRAGWGLMGYSEGGYCAAQLTLRHPDLYAAGVSISGYDAPQSSEFLSKPSQLAAGRLATLLRTAPAVALLASASREDPQSSGSLTALRREARPPTFVTTTLYPQGGHNTGQWSAQLAQDFLWLSRQVGGVAR